MAGVDSTKSLQLMVSGADGPVDGCSGGPGSVHVGGRSPTVRHRTVGVGIRHDSIDEDGEIAVREVLGVLDEGRDEIGDASTDVQVCRRLGEQVDVVGAHPTGSSGLGG